MEKAAFKRKKVPFASKLELNTRQKPVKCTFGAEMCMVLKNGHFGKF